VSVSKKFTFFSRRPEIASSMSGRSGNGPYTISSFMASTIGLKRRPFVTIKVSPHQGFRRIHPAFPEGVCNDKI
jgi:hypothetical protein